MEKFKLSSSLPSKEAKYFKKVLKFYDLKKYKSGIKFCKQILSNEKCQRHCDTLSIYAMMLFFIGQKDEAIKLVKTSLSFDIKSTITWHSYGIINKYDHNFEESSKCLRQALKFDPENTQILMELGSLQVHIRDYQNAAETRHKLLKLRSGQRQIWIAYIIALELSKQTSSASAILKAFVESIEEKEDQTSGTCANSYSGILLFQIQLYILESNYKEALKIIETRESSILDKFKLFELKLTIYMNSKNVKSALKVCIHLIKLNPDNQKYYRYLGEILPTNSSQISLKIALYFHNMFPRAIYPAIYLLEHCESGNFLDIFEDYAKKAISKGQPNLFSSLKFLYSQTSKVKIIESFMFRILNDNNFESHSLWVWYYLGQHFNHINNYERALEFSDTAVTHNPTFIDGYVIRGQIYKNMGNIKKLIETISIAHALDEADRNINSIFANVLIKYHELKQAEDLMSIYTTKPNSFWDYMKDIHCIWLFQKTSKMYFNKSDFKKTLNICMIFENLYKTFENDPMDFHMYCMRKGTFNSYSNLCHDSWKLRDNIMYFKVARVAVKALLISLIIGSEANIHKNSFIDSNETIKTFISPLLLFDKNIKNYYLAFEYYYLTKKVLLMLKVLLPLIKYEPSNPKTIFNYIRFLNFYSSCVHDDFCSKLLSHYPEIINYGVSPSHKFPEGHIFTPLYEYRNELFLEDKSLCEEKFLEIFDHSLSSCSKKWLICYEIYKEFIFTLQLLKCSQIGKILTTKMLTLFPDCCLDKRLSDHFLSS